jgi:hypothetical protein
MSQKGVKQRRRKKQRLAMARKRLGYSLCQICEKRRNLSSFVNYHTEYGENEKVIKACSFCNYVEYIVRTYRIRQQDLWFLRFIIKELSNQRYNVSQRQIDNIVLLNPNYYWWYGRIVKGFPLAQKKKYEIQGFAKTVFNYKLQRDVPDTFTFSWVQYCIDNNINYMGKYVPDLAKK